MSTEEIRQARRVAAEKLRYARMILGEGNFDEQKFEAEVFFDALSWSEQIQPAVRLAYTRRPFM